jgi:hypothetical protein
MNFFYYWLNNIFILLYSKFYLTFKNSNIFSKFDLYKSIIIKSLSTLSLYRFKAIGNIEYNNINNLTRYFNIIIFANFIP